MFFTLHFLFPIGNNPTLATPQSALRLTAPLEGAALRGKDLGLVHSLRRAPLAPLLGELAAKPPEGSPVYGEYPLGKDKAEYKTPLSFRDQCSHLSEHPNL